MLTQTKPTAHHLHPHHIACPNCGQHTVVVKDENHFVCLNCRWSRNISRGSGFFEIFIITIVIVVLLSMLP